MASSLGQMEHQNQSYQQAPNVQQQPQMQQQNLESNNPLQRGEPQNPQQPQQTSSQQIQYTLYVGDLAKDVTEDLLFQEFSQFGQINLKIVKDRDTKESKGYAFVNFSDQQSAQKAYEQLNYKPLHGKCIRIMFNQKDSQARNQIQNNIFIKNIEKAVNSRMLYDYFSQFGQIITCKVATDEFGESKGFGFVQYQTEEEAQKAITSCNGVEFASKVIFVGPFIKNQQRQSSSESFNNLYINNLPSDIKEEDLKDLFSQHGSILSLALRKDKKDRPFAFVCFDQPENALKAKENLHQFEYKGIVMNVVRFENKSERQKKLTKEYLEKKRKQAEISKGCNLYVKNIDKEITEEQLKVLFGKYGEITSCRIMTEKQYVTNNSQLGQQQRSKGFGFVCFLKPQDAERAQTELSKITVNDQHLYIRFAEPKDQRQQRLQQIQTKYGTLGFSGNNNQQQMQMYQMIQQQQQWMWQQQMMQQFQMQFYRQNYQPYFMQQNQMRRPYPYQNPQFQQQINRNTLGQKAILHNQMRQGQMRRQQNQYRNNEMQQQQQQEQQILNPQELQGKSQQEQQQIIGETIYKLIFKDQPQQVFIQNGWKNYWYVTRNGDKCADVIIEKSKATK